jgi:hypothetical protein
MKKKKEKEKTIRNHSDSITIHRSGVVPCPIDILNVEYLSRVEYLPKGHSVTDKKHPKRQS